MPPPHSAGSGSGLRQRRPGRAAAALGLHGGGDRPECHRPHRRPPALPGYLPFHQAIASPEAIEALALGPFDLVVSTEVVEHCYAPRQWAAGAFTALRPGGLLIASTPYHGYLKNLALAASGKLDGHFTALWDGGHIKFWSRRTLSTLLTDAGFEPIAFRGAGRWPWLWKSMLIAARKPLL